MYLQESRYLINLILCALLLTACQQATHEHKHEHALKSAEIIYLNMPGMADKGLPFSSAVQVDNMLYLSGNIGSKPGTLELVQGGIQAETGQALDNIKKVVQQFGSSMDRVVKCTVFLADMNEWGR